MLSADDAFHRAQVLAELKSELSFDSFAYSFTKARDLGRRITVLTGPPNSGKTHKAFQLLSAAPSGTYLAPLRLLALEGRDALSDLGCVCDLLTGEDYEPGSGDGETEAVRAVFVLPAIFFSLSQRLVPLSNTALLDPLRLDDRNVESSKGV